MEWYFGYKVAHSDLTCEDWGSRDLFWDQCKIALDFLNGNNLPYAKMKAMDSLIVGNGKTIESAEGDYCMALPGDTYIVYIKDGDEVSLSLEKGTYEVQWLNPRKGGGLQKGKVSRIKAKSKGDYSLGMPPAKDGKDWVALLTAK